LSNDASRARGMESAVALAIVIANLIRAWVIRIIIGRPGQHLAV
jgi:hypothetical protein